MFKDRDLIRTNSDSLAQLLDILEILDDNQDLHLSVTVNNKSFEITDYMLITNIKNYVSERAKQHLDSLKLSTL